MNADETADLFQKAATLAKKEVNLEDWIPSVTGPYETEVWRLIAFLPPERVGVNISISYGYLFITVSFEGRDFISSTFQLPNERPTSTSVELNLKDSKEKICFGARNSESWLSTCYIKPPFPVSLIREVINTYVQQKQHEELMQALAIGNLTQD